MTLSVGGLVWAAIDFLFLACLHVVAAGVGLRRLVRRRFKADLGATTEPPAMPRRTAA